MAYIPSARVLQEGGYEGKTSMLEYGWPSPFCPDVEQRILNEVESLMAEVVTVPPSLNAPSPELLSAA